MCSRKDKDKDMELVRREASLLLQTPETLLYSDYERRIRKENKEYLEKMKSILTAPRKGFMKGSDWPGELLDYLYIGNMREARNPRVLRRFRITHVLNCAAQPKSACDDGDGFLYDPETSGVTSYEEFEACDNDGYPILSHFNRAKRFIDQARDSGGRALVHCELGVNRSGAICIAYMMLAQNITLLQVLKRVKRERPVVLVNEGFQKQLIEFARDHDLLYKDNSTNLF